MSVSLVGIDVAAAAPLLQPLLHTLQAVTERMGSGSDAGDLQPHTPQSGSDAAHPFQQAQVTRDIPGPRPLVVAAALQLDPARLRLDVHLMDCRVMAVSTQPGSASRAVALTFIATARIAADTSNPVARVVEVPQVLCPSLMGTHRSGADFLVRCLAQPVTTNVALVVQDAEIFTARACAHQLTDETSLGWASMLPSFGVPSNAIDFTQCITVSDASPPILSKTNLQLDVAMEQPNIVAVDARNVVYLLSSARKVPGGLALIHRANAAYSRRLPSTRTRIALQSTAPVHVNVAFSDVQTALALGSEFASPSPTVGTKARARRASSSQSNTSVLSGHRGTPQATLWVNALAALACAPSADFHADDYELVIPAGMRCAPALEVHKIYSETVLTLRENLTGVAALSAIDSGYGARQRDDDMLRFGSIARAGDVLLSINGFSVATVAEAELALAAVGKQRVLRLRAMPLVVAVSLDAVLATVINNTYGRFDDVVRITLHRTMLTAAGNDLSFSGAEDASLAVVHAGALSLEHTSPHGSRAASAPAHATAAAMAAARAAAQRRIPSASAYATMLARADVHVYNPRNEQWEPVVEPFDVDAVLSQLAVPARPSSSSGMLSGAAGVVATRHVSARVSPALNLNVSADMFASLAAALVSFQGHTHTAVRARGDFALTIDRARAVVDGTASTWTTPAPATAFPVILRNRTGMSLALHRCKDQRGSLFFSQDVAYRRIRNSDGSDSTTPDIAVDTMASSAAESGCVTLVNDGACGLGVLRASNVRADDGLRVIDVSLDGGKRFVSVDCIAAGASTYHADLYNERVGAPIAFPLQAVVVLTGNRRTVTLYSMISVSNYSSSPLVLQGRSRGAGALDLGVIPPRTTVSVPVHASHVESLGIAPAEANKAGTFDMVRNWAWSSDISLDRPGQAVATCSPTTAQQRTAPGVWTSATSFIMGVRVLHQRGGAFIRVILHAAAAVHNLLPSELHIQLRAGGGGSGALAEAAAIPPGESREIFSLPWPGITAPTRVVGEPQLRMALPGYEYSNFVTVASTGESPAVCRRRDLPPTALNEVSMGVAVSMDSLGEDASDVSSTLSSSGDGGASPAAARDARVVHASIVVSAAVWVMNNTPLPLRLGVSGDGGDVDILEVPTKQALANLVEVVWENQVRRTGEAWEAAVLDTDGVPPWADVHGCVTQAAAIAAPGREGCQIVSPWQAGAWTYDSTLAALAAAGSEVHFVPSHLDLARRRRWTRVLAPHESSFTVAAKSTAATPRELAVRVNEAPVTDAASFMPISGGRRVFCAMPGGDWSYPTDTSVTGQVNPLVVIGKAATDAGPRALTPAYELMCVTGSAPPPFDSTRTVAFHPRIIIINATSAAISVRQAFTCDPNVTPVLYGSQEIAPLQQVPWWWADSRALNVGEAAQHRAIQISPLVAFGAWSPPIEVELDLTSPTRRVPLVIPIKAGHMYMRTSLGPTPAGAVILGVTIANSSAISGGVEVIVSMQSDPGRPLRPLHDCLLNLGEVGTLRAQAVDDAVPAPLDGFRPASARPSGSSEGSVAPVSDSSLPTVPTVLARSVQAYMASGVTSPQIAIVNFSRFVVGYRQHDPAVYTSLGQRMAPADVRDSVVPKYRAAMSSASKPLLTAAEPYQLGMLYAKCVLFVPPRTASACGLVHCSDDDVHVVLAIQDVAIASTARTDAQRAFSRARVVKLDARGVVTKMTAPNGMSALVRVAVSGSAVRIYVIDDPLTVTPLSASISGAASGRARSGGDLLSRHRTGSNSSWDIVPSEEADVDTYTQVEDDSQAWMLPLPRSAELDLRLCPSDADIAKWLPHMRHSSSGGGSDSEVLPPPDALATPVVPVLSPWRTVLSAELAAASVSMIDNTPREMLVLTITNIKLSRTVDASVSSTRLDIADIQLDDMHPDAAFPVVLRIIPRTEKASADAIARGTPPISTFKRPFVSIELVTTGAADALTGAMDEITLRMLRAEFGRIRVSVSYELVIRMQRLVEGVIATNAMHASRLKRQLGDRFDVMDIPANVLQLISPAVHHRAMEALLEAGRQTAYMHVKTDAVRTALARDIALRGRMFGRLCAAYLVADASTDMLDISVHAGSGSMDLQPVRIVLDYGPSSRSAAAASESGEHVFKALPPLVKMALRSALSITGAQVRLVIPPQEGTFTLRQVLSQLQSILQPQLQAQIVNVIGSTDLPINPIGMFRDVRKGITRGFDRFAAGLTHMDAAQTLQGAASAATSTVAAAARASAGVTGFIGSTARAIAQVGDAPSTERAKPREKASNVGSGFLMGLHAVGSGFVGAVTGVVTSPMQGMAQEGAMGGLKGLGKGVLGLIAKPVAGVATGITHVLDGVGSNLQDEETAILNTTQAPRKRLPRVLYAPGAILREFNADDAACQELLPHLQDGRYAPECLAASAVLTRPAGDHVLVTGRFVMVVASDRSGEVRQPVMRVAAIFTTELQVRDARSCAVLLHMDDGHAASLEFADVRAAQRVMLAIEAVQASLRAHAAPPASSSGAASART